MFSDAALQFIFLSICDFIRRKNRQEVIVIKAKLITASEEQLDDSCPICLEKYQKDEQIVNLKCRHLFHKECFQKWCQKSVKCPLCRQICTK